MARACVSLATASEARPACRSLRPSPSSALASSSGCPIARDKAKFLCAVGGGLDGVIGSQRQDAEVVEGSGLRHPVIDVAELAQCRMMIGDGCLIVAGELLDQSKLVQGMAIHRTLVWLDGSVHGLPNAGDGRRRVAS